MDYCCPDRRKTKGDKRAKGRYMKYKRGGAFRSANVSLSGNREEKK
ncbi:MAG: hypothetical protein Q8L29_00835 [archaeon]|nr:hypothetical protein [archaeon]